MEKRTAKKWVAARGLGRFWLSLPVEERRELARALREVGAAKAQELLQRAVERVEAARKRLRKATVAEAFVGEVLQKLKGWQELGARARKRRTG